MILNKKVLIVEDDEDFAEVMGIHLEENGYEVQKVHSGDDVINLLQTVATPPGVVILDLLLPGWNGRALLPKIKESWPETKIIVYTGMEEDRHEFLDIIRYADRFLKKSGEISRLVSSVQSVAA